MFRPPLWSDGNTTENHTPGCCRHLRNTRTYTHTHTLHFICRFNVLFKFFAYYFVPLLLIAVLYILVAHQLHVSARDMPGNCAGPQGKAQRDTRRHVAKMVLTFVIGELWKNAVQRRKMRACMPVSLAQVHEQ